MERVPYHGHHERLTDAALEELIRRSADPGPQSAGPARDLSTPSRRSLHSSIEEAPFQPTPSRRSLHSSIEEAPFQPTPSRRSLHSSIEEAPFQPTGLNSSGTAALLRRQPGFYGASIAELDLLVDLAQEVEGVLGSGLMGAGGGGIVEILAQEREEVGAAVQDALASGYYEPRGQPVQVERWRSVAAASRLEG